MMDPERNTQWSLETKYLVSIGLVIFAIFVIYLMRPVLPILILASLIAFVASPSIHYLTRRLKIPRGAAVAITYLLASILILIIPFVLLPQIVSAVNFVVQLDYAELINDIRQWAETTLILLRDDDLHILGFTIVMDRIVDPILGAVQNVTPLAPPEPASLTALLSSLGQALTRSVNLVLGVAGSIGTGVASFLLMILASIYLSQDAYKIRDLIVNNLPPAYQPEIDSLLFRLRNTWNNFLMGQVSLMVFIGVFVWIGATILGLPGALALGILSGILELLPNVGPILAAIPAIIIALTQGSNHFAISNWVFTLIVIGFYVAVQQIENIVVVPRLMGRAVKLHPLVVILGVFVGALSFGILGAILATPAIASVKEIIRYLYLKIRGLPVEVELPTQPSSPRTRSRPRRNKP
jgi:predicted PurR-regulated permease PerM